ncbi:cholesterol 7-desaturase nvd-like isoform X1 [Brevipalpus obovatus]|uniref:cholesterol 7-desaturase nvd-like isoform X1 n=2 Tax=Brevipalpus obovatus TaxID=246614 RepID=UPI003D9EBD41
MLKNSMAELFSSTKTSTLNHVDLLILTLYFCVLYFLVKIFINSYNVIRFLAFDDLSRDYSEPRKDAKCNGPYPNGWIPATESYQLAPGGMKTVEMCGKQILITRDSDGKVHAMDTYCPHNGTDLGTGQMVRIKGEDCIRCPFHDWSFRVKDGECVDIPYAKDRKPTRSCRVGTYQCVEVNNYIYVWFHSRGDDPDWFPEVIKEVESGEWAYHGRTEHIVNCKIDEIPENGSDWVHFNAVHNKSFLFGGSLDKRPSYHPYSLINQDFLNCTWAPRDAPNSHCAVNVTKSHVNFAGIPVIKLDVAANQHGPSIVNLIFDAEFLGIPLKGAYIQSVTPIHYNKQRIIHQVYMEKSFVSNFVGRCLLVGVLLVVERDCSLWKNKIHMQKPFLVKEDKDLLKFRRWFSRFYDENENECNNMITDW